MAIEGIDFSEGGFPSIATLQARGIKFVGRYAVNDLSPHGRGITADEYRRYRDAAIDVILYWEGQESWMLGGWDAGVAAARNAQQNIVNAGMPLTTPVHFAHDIDPDPAHYSAIDQCLSGAASVIGWPRVGAYGGHLLIDYLAGGGTMKLLVETIAWQYGRGWHPAATIQQYDTANVPFDGVPCDLLRAVVPNYGQASLHHIPPAPIPQPAPKPTPNTVPGIPLPAGVSVQLLERLYTGSPDNKLIIGGQAISFDPNDEVSRAWLQRCIASIPHGKPWRDGSWPPIKDRIRRGVNGKDGTDFLLGDGHIIHADAHGHVAA